MLADAIESKPIGSSFRYTDDSGLVPNAPQGNWITRYGTWTCGPKHLREAYWAATRQGGEGEESFTDRRYWPAPPPEFQLNGISYTDVEDDVAYAIEIEKRMRFYDAQLPPHLRPRLPAGKTAPKPLDEIAEQARRFAHWQNERWYATYGNRKPTRAQREAYQQDFDEHVIPGSGWIPFGN